MDCLPVEEVTTIVLWGSMSSRHSDKGLCIMYVRKHYVQHMLPLQILKALIDQVSKLALTSRAFYNGECGFWCIHISWAAQVLLQWAQADIGLKCTCLGGLSIPSNSGTMRTISCKIDKAIFFQVSMPARLPIFRCVDYLWTRLERSTHRSMNPCFACDKGGLNSAQ